MSSQPTLQRDIIPSHKSKIAKCNLEINGKLFQNEMEKAK